MLGPVTMDPSLCKVVLFLALFTICHGAPDRFLNPDGIYFPAGYSRESIHNISKSHHWGALIIPFLLVPNSTKLVVRYQEESPRIENSNEKVTYNGAQVWKVPTDTVKKLQIVYDLTRHHNVSSWGGNHTAIDIMIRQKNRADVIKILNDNNITYTVSIEDLQQYIEDENPEVEISQNRQARAYTFWKTYRTKGRISMPVKKSANRRIAALGAYMGYNSLDEHMEYWPTANWGHRLTWQQYHRLSDIHDYLHYLTKTHSFCSTQSIGKSVENKDLIVLRISNGQAKKSVWIDGGIHAREWISPATVTYIINYIVESFVEGDDDMIRDIDWYFLPVVNPDGYEYTHTVDRLWRKNRKRNGACNGVDLNRNFGYEWGGKGTSQDPCSEVYCGQYAFSEPESKAIKDFMDRSDADFKLYLTYHSYGQYILYPWGYDRKYTSDFSDLDSAGRKAAVAISRTGGSLYTVGVSSVVLYPAAGGSDDWAKGAKNIKYSYTIELSDMGRYGFILPASQILKVGKESVAGMMKLVEAAYRS